MRGRRFRAGAIAFFKRVHDGLEFGGAFPAAVLAQHRSRAQEIDARHQTHDDFAQNPIVPDQDHLEEKIRRGDVAERVAGSLWIWPVFWCYLLWTVGQSAAAMFGPWMSELFPVEMRSTAVATIYTLGRTIGASAPIIVPSLAASFGGALIKGMVFGSVGSMICLVVAFFLPETAGRRFSMLEGRERDPEELRQPWAEGREA